MMKGKVTIKAYLSVETLIIKVSDNGSGMDATTLEGLQKKLAEDDSLPGGKNIGIKNVHDRIRLHFGEEYGLEM
ncbi:hypothetical protein AF332_03560 [Sporosarcina globispora]|uniref:Histidine kinase/HSP90-like ATPase domain-containing protein n=1 Tax=Sporosarcina globispora TaxID=1459 RepID=A0A0M0G979_SPOGL|nr:hypothetical protein [Sporosarcina globispora]KON85976.1 hypothetical protein AF332_03560 [Sporosarcina globispora]